MKKLTEPLPRERSRDDDADRSRTAFAVSDAPTYLSQALCAGVQLEGRAIHMNVSFEKRRLYVAPRKSVLFFALVGDRRLRCYVKHAILLEPQSVPRDEAEAHKHYLSAYDRNRDLIQASARRLIEANVLEPDGAVIVSSVAFALEDATKLAPTA